MEPEEIEIKNTKEVKPQFAQGKLEPRYFWLMRTNKDVAKLQERLIEQMTKDMPSIPKELVQKLVLKNTKNVSCTHEWHTIVVAEDMATKESVLFLSDYHAHDGAPSHGSTHEMMRDTDMEGNIANARMNALNIQYKENWKGERQTPHEIEAEAWPEFTKALTGEVKEVFDLLYPESVVESLSVAEGIKGIGVVPQKTYNRQALVKRFGEKKVAELEKKVGIKKVKVKHG